MINWIKGHLKVLDSVRSAEKVSVCNIFSGHSWLKKSFDTFLTSLHSNMTQFEIKLEHYSLLNGLLGVILSLKKHYRPLHYKKIHLVKALVLFTRFSAVSYNIKHLHQFRNPSNTFQQGTC